MDNASTTRRLAGVLWASSVFISFFLVIVESPGQLFAQTVRIRPCVPGTSGCPLPTIRPRCGNRIVEGSEQCDDGNRINTDACTNACLRARCGDRYVQTGVEECDDGNSINTDACRNTCRRPRCGDTIVDTGEQCDDGNSVNTDACRNNCQQPRCGDGLVDAGEQCDDGNVVAGDGCSATCQNEPRCGNGVVETGEECEPPGTADCDKTCHRQQQSQCTPPYPTCWIDVEFGDNAGGEDIAVDSGGNVIVVGQGDSTPTGAGGGTIFVRKYDPCGNEMWTDTTTRDYAVAVALDASDNIYVTGRSESTIPGGGTYTAFTRKYTPSGTISWTVTAPAADGCDIKVDSSGNVFVAGRHDTYNPGTLSWAPQPWLIKYVPPPGGGWPLIGCEATPSSTGEHKYQGLTLDGAGGVFVTGSGPGGASQSIWVRKYDSSCVIDPAFGAGGEVFYDTASFDIGEDITFDSSGNLAVVGLTDWTSGFSGTGPNIWVGKYSSTGPAVWDPPLIIGESYWDWGSAVVADAGGHIFTAGYKGSEGMGETYYTSRDAWFAKINDDKTIACEQVFNDVGYGMGAARADGIALDSANNIYVTGSIQQVGGDWGAGHFFIRKYPSDCICPSE